MLFQANDDIEEMRNCVKMRRDLKLSEFKIENPFGAKLAKMINIERDPELTDEEYKDI